MASGGNNRRRRHVTGPTLKAALIAGFFGNSMVLIYAIVEGSATRTYAVGTLASLAAGAVGGGAGFLFALPRYVPEEHLLPRPNEQHPPSAGQPEAARQGFAFIPSDNLVQVSDWLTKLLIGAGLVQLGNLSRGAGHLVDVVAAGLSNTAKTTIPSSARVVAGSILVFYVLLAFLWFYGNTSLSYGHLMEMKVHDKV